MIELPKNININEHAIELVEGKQLPYRPIYTLSQLEIETLKIYIKTHLKTGFIWSSKSPTGAPIFFDKKSDCSFHLYINYQSLDNLIIKNCFPLPLIDMSLNRLDRAKHFTKLDLSSEYH